MAAGPSDARGLPGGPGGAPGLADVLDLVTCFCSDQAPVAAVATFARCSAHFRSYLVAGEARTLDWCSSCACYIDCRVTGHRHVDGGTIVYVGEGIDYVWRPATQSLRCLACFEKSRGALRIGGIWCAMTWENAAQRQNELHW